jgi:Ca2+-binding EF-hand superfamily protein
MATEARKLFDSVDLNQDGVLTRGELINALRLEGRQEPEDVSLTSLGFRNLDEVADLFDTSDADHNKEVTFEEFEKTLKGRRR